MSRTTSVTPPKGSLRSPTNKAKSSAHQPTRSGRKTVTKKRVPLPATIHCGWCQMKFKPKRATTKFCSRQCATTSQMSKTSARKNISKKNTKEKVSVPCECCGKQMLLLPCYAYGKRPRRFCDRSCRSKWIRATLPNPMENPETVAKARASMKGRTFLSRGGNGQPTKPQLLLAKVTGLPIEYPIPTKAVKGQFESLPDCYKVDLADPKKKLAIEVDGHSHRSKKWRFLDRRKTEVLNALGWSVLRFTNEEVLTDPKAAARVIRSTTSK